MRLADLARLAGVSTSMLRGMADEGLLRQEEMPSHAAAAPDPDHPGIALNDEQTAAATAISSAIDQNAYQPFVLDGVTGSGKTEVYFEAIAATLRARRQALILLPEIALSPAMVDRFAARFGVAPCSGIRVLVIASGRTHGRRSAIPGQRLLLGPVQHFFCRLLISG